MGISRKKSSLRVKVTQGHSVIERSLGSKDSLTIGRSPDNDIVIFNDRFPKKHTLLKCDHDKCELYLTKDMRGEIRHKESRISLQDLVVQELLPKKGDFYNLQFSHGRSGYIRIDDANISFLYDGADTTLKGVPDYSWAKANLRSIGKDGLFKTLFLVFFALELFWGMSVSNIKLQPIAPPDINKVPQRFAKFVLKQPKQEVPAETLTTTGGQEAGSEADQKQKKRKSKPKRSGGSSGKKTSKPVTAQGLLGLIGGSGQSGQKSSSVDFLIDKGLVKQLDQLLGNTKLSKRPGSGGLGNGSGKGVGAGTGDGIDDLLSFGLTGGVDDLIENDGVQKVKMKKKGQVQLQTPSKMRGSQAAMGRRSPENVMQVINSQQGRIMYTYNKYLRTNPNLSGKVSLDVTIEANGRISKITVIESTIASQDFVRDLTNIIRRLKFPPIAEGSITINLPFVFNRAG